MTIVFLCAPLFLTTGVFAQKQRNNRTGKTKDGKKLAMQTINETEKRKKLIRNLYENVLNNRRFELLDDLIADEYVGIGGEKGAKGFLKTVETVIAGFPDIKWKVEDICAEGDKVAIRWTWTATNSAPFRGLPATDKVVSDNAIVIYEFKNEKIVRAWIQSDRLGVLQQIGVIKTDAIPNSPSLFSDGKKSNARQILIDKFVVPEAAKAEFLERMRINLELIKRQPGFLETTAYEKTGGDGEFNYVTVAVWENEDALAKAKRAVSAEYQKQGFDLQEMLKRLNIKIDRAAYKKLAD